MYGKKIFWFLSIPVFLFCSSPVFAASVDMGKAENNYQMLCSMCHGHDGDGKGDLAPTLPVPPRNHTDASIMSKRTDAQIFKTISEGGDATGFDAAMPPHNTVISKEEIEGLVQYIRHLCNCKFTK